MSSKALVFGSRLSPFVEKVVRALALKGIDFELVPPRGPRDFSRWNPQTKKMPVLEIDGERTYDSTFIIRRLEELVPDPPLTAGDGATAAAQRPMRCSQGLEDAGKRKLRAELGRRAGKVARVLEILQPRRNRCRAAQNADIVAQPPGRPMPADRLLLRLREIIEGVELDRREAAAQPLEQASILREQIVAREQALDVGCARKGTTQLGRAIVEKAENRGHGTFPGMSDAGNVNYSYYLGNNSFYLHRSAAGQM